MRKLLIAVVVCLFSIICFSSCVTTAHAYGYHTNNESENVVVVNDTCYVYYTNPTTAFLNTLHIIDGAYFYWHMGRYINVVFPYWSVWSPYRYFYFENNVWNWRWRNGYNHIHHDYYRQHYRWNDYRHHRPYHYNHRPNIHTQPHQPNIGHHPNVSTRPNVNHRPNATQRTEQFRPNHNMRPNVNGGQRSFTPRINHQMTRPNVSQPRMMQNRGNGIGDRRR